jgi:hypothetical protein
MVRGTKGRVTGPGQRVALVSPEFPHSGRVPMVPPILEYLGALTLREAPDAALHLVDGNVTPVRPEELDADLVGVSVWTATAPWAYRFADACRAAGKRVVLGGIHATALPDEAAEHADAVVVGEAESVWGEVLRDARAGRLRARYDGEQRPLGGLVTPLDAGLPGHYEFRGFFTMRGCPYSCSFCSVHCFFGRTIRYRPVEEVADEIEARAGRLWFNGDDNIWGADPDRAVALFDALAARSRRWWYGFGDLRSVQGPDGERILRAARRSGLVSVWAGWESDVDANLRGLRAAGKQGRDRVEAIRRMQGQGIDVTLFVMLGGRDDDGGAFGRTLELSERLGVGIHPVLVTPLPGTPLFDEYRPHLLPGLGWEAFTGVRAVHAHPDPALTPLRREALYHDLCHEVFRTRRILRRVAGIPAAGFPMSHLVSLVSQFPMKVALGKAREAFLAGPGASLAPRPAPAPRPHRAPALASASRVLRDVALGAWIAALACLVFLEVEERWPTLPGFEAARAGLEPKVEALTWAGLATVAATSAAALLLGPGLRRARRRLAARSLRLAAVVRLAMVAAATIAHGVLAFVD